MSNSSDSDSSEDSINLIPTVSKESKKTDMEDISSDSSNDVVIIAPPKKRTRGNRTRNADSHDDDEKKTRVKRRRVRRVRRGEEEKESEEKPEEKSNSDKEMSEKEVEEHNKEMHEEESVNDREETSSSKNEKVLAEETHPSVVIKDMDSDDQREVCVKIPEHEKITEVTHAITREKKVSLKGTSYTYRFIKQDEIVFSSKCKGRNPTKPMPIVSGSVVHLSAGGEYYLIPDKTSTEYELRKESVSGPLVLAAKIMHNIHNLMMPRTVIVEILDDTIMPKTTLITKRPKMNMNGTFTLHFNNRFAIPSEKNAIFIDHELGRDSPNMISIRRIGKSTLELISDSRIPEVVVFSVGLVMFTGDLAC